ncbi:SERPINE1 mRNA-binding protein 1-like isoform X2 [Culicoides brevitarsis]|uniref:SERPINE1 mRNA-binding protein 1-like isoform X2 n=1 Tax=Culicoides brevitarsis TaxID=469753 RepID=UPI00307B5791
MENSYGIGITNRYDLFYLDDDEQDPFEQLKQKKAKSAANAVAAVNAAPNATAVKKAPAAVINTNVKSNVNNNNKTAEKENKISASNKSNQNNEKTGSGNKGGNAQRPKGIKETGNLKTLDNRGPRDDKDKNANPKNFDRPQNKEDRNNRRNRDGQNGPVGEFNREDRPRRQGGQGRDGGDKPRFDRRGKREFDRQSGSDKTGVKAVDKRDGGGAHNWGSHKQDLDDLNKGTEYLTDGEKNDSAVEETKEGDAAADGEAKPVEEEVKEMTLDEWKAQRAATRAKPQYNLRKAGEGEDNAQWKKMVPLDKKKACESEESDTDKNNANQHGAGKGEKKKVLDIDFHFNDSRRSGGGLGRPRRGGKREFGDKPRFDGPRDGPREGQRDGPKPEGGNERAGGENRGPRGPRRNERRQEREDRRGPTAPKVDDERDFPSLG